MSRIDYTSHCKHFLSLVLQEEAFLEDVNMLLNTADIPNIYENEERLEIIEKVRPVKSITVSTIMTMRLKN